MQLLALPLLGGSGAAGEGRREVSKCAHETFNAFVDVNRITQVEGGPVVVYCADVRVNCRDCGQELEFVGLPNGMSFYRPTVSINSQEARLPMVLPGETVPEGMAGFRVTHKVVDLQKAVEQ
jgi:hypothetical protein